MAVVIHNIGGNRYAYSHHREGKKVRAIYIGPVDSHNRIRSLKTDEIGVNRVEVGTTVTSLKKIYMKAVRNKEIEDRM